MYANGYKNMTLTKAFDKTIEEQYTLTKAVSSDSGAVVEAVIGTDRELEQADRKTRLKVLNAHFQEMQDWAKKQG